MSEIELYSGDNPLDPYVRAQLDAALEKARDTEGTILNDLEKALNLIRDYQRHLQRFHSADPSFVEARTLLRKYGMTPGAEPDQSFRVYADGVDISLHPDSVEGTIAEVKELPEAIDD